MVDCKRICLSPEFVSYLKFSEVRPQFRRGSGGGGEADGSWEEASNSILTFVLSLDVSDECTNQDRG